MNPDDRGLAWHMLGAAAAAIVLAWLLWPAGRSVAVSLAVVWVLAVAWLLGQEESE